MGASIQSTRDILAAARGSLLSELESAGERLGSRYTSDAHIHEVRKTLKRARAALRLLRGLTGTRDYRRDNAAIRDAARPLTPVRDGKVLLQTLRDLVGADGEVVGGFASQLRSELRTQRLTERGRLSARVLRDSATLLRQVHDRVSLLAIPGHAAPRTMRGLVRTYKMARRAFRRTADRRTDGRLHEWRKQTRYLACQLEILETPGSGFFAKNRKRANQVAEVLGQDHDLALLAGRIRRTAPRADLAGRRGKAELMHRLQARRAKFQRRVLRLGRRLFSARPRQFQL